MKTTSKCLNCEVEGALEQIKLSTDNEELRFEALQSVLAYLSESSIISIPPAEMGTECNRIIREITSNPDPYKKVKKKMNEIAGELASIANKYIEKGGEMKSKLSRAIKVATIGNSFDFSVSEHEVELSTSKEKFKEALREDIYLDDRDALISKLLSADEILYILDNSGEVILDRLLLEKIEDLELDLTISARSGPVQDDVTLEMVKDLSLAELGKLIPAGQSAGVNPRNPPEKLREKLDEADIIISKGQGNFETLSEHEERYKGRIAYLLMAKCEPVSNQLDVPRGSKVVYLLRE